MNRREFINTAGATALIPVLPTSAMASPVAKTPALTAKVGWAALYARTHAKATPALIQTWLGVGAEQAHVLMSELVRTNVLNAPVGGVATVVEPMFRPKAVPGAQPVTRDLTRKAKEFITDALNDENPPQEPEPFIEEQIDEAS